MFYSPLRYPGGKNKLADFIAKICIDNNLKGHYIEPYAGGASVALFLLFRNVVDKITINDKDRSVYAFWYSVLHHTDKLCELIANTDITIDNWHIQKEVQKNKNKAHLLELGFSTLFLNRTNMSGILNAGVIGGFEQKGEYKLNCRFNKQEIITRIQNIAKKKKQIKLYQQDAIKLIEKIQQKAESENTIFYFDPPYYMKGNSLYMNYYKENDHLAISEKIKQIKNIQWIISYDNVPEIQSLYSNYRKKEYTLQHTARKSKTGKEILFFSNKLHIPAHPKNWNPINFKMQTTTDITYI